MKDDYPPLEFVRERPTNELPQGSYHCPSCDRESPNRRYDMTTLLGGGDGTWNGDPNHTHAERTCPHCRATWTRETKSGQVWYTDAANVVLRGFPKCYETYVYHCARCADGLVTRDYRKPDGTAAHCLSYTFTKPGEPEPTPAQYAHWTCSNCGELSP